MPESEKFSIQKGPFLVRFDQPPNVPSHTKMEAGGVNAIGSAQHKFLVPSGLNEHGQPAPVHIQLRSSRPSQEK